MRTKIRRRPNGRWYVMAVDEDGTEHGHGGYRTQREAKAAAAALRTDSVRGTYVAPERLTVAEYLIGEWLPSRANADISPNTRDTDRTVVEAWILPHMRRAAPETHRKVAGRVVRDAESSRGAG